MYFICSYAGFRCLIEACQKSVKDVLRFKEEFGLYYKFEKMEELRLGDTYDLSIKIVKHSNSRLKSVYEKFDRVRIHSSHSRNVKYLLDGSVFRQEDANQYAFVKAGADHDEFFLEGSNTLVKVYKNKRHIDISGDRLYDNLVYIYETLFNSFMEYKGGIAAHAASCSLNGKGIIISGESGSGKTTLLFDLIFRNGVRFHSNDRLFILKDKNGSGLFSYSVPIPVNVPIKTMRNLIHWKENSVVKNAPPDSKIRYKVHEIPLLFSDKVDSYMTVDYILSVKYDDSEPKAEKIAPHEIISQIELLTPYDECHPKWLPLFGNDNLTKGEVADVFLDWLNNVEIYRVSGSNLIMAFGKVLSSVSF